MSITFSMRYPGGRDRALTLSYDDGVIFDTRLIEIMKRGSLKGTFNINGGIFPEQDAIYTKPLCRMSRRQAYELYSDSGMEVAIHGACHLHWSSAPAGVTAYDIVTDRAALEEMFGTIIRGGAYPFGAVSDDARETLRLAGLAYCRTIDSTERFDLPTDWLRLSATCHHNNPRLMELAREFIEMKRTEPYPPLFYLWGHSYEFHDDDNWNVIEQFVDYVGNRENVWYATNIEIYDYVEAFRRLHISMDGRRFYNPSFTELWFVAHEKLCHIRPGETLVL